MPVRIGIEAQRIYRENKHGMDFVALELIRHLQELDLENEYFIFVQKGPEHNLLQETANFKIIQFVAPYPVIEQILIPVQVRRLKLDLLHFTSNTAALYPATKLMVTLHDIIFMEQRALFSAGFTLYQAFGNLYRRMVFKRLLDRVDHWITVSNYEKANIEESYPEIGGEKLKVVYNGYGSHFKPIEDRQILNRVKEQYQLPDQFLVFLGNTDPKKNSPRMIQAFAEYLERYPSDLKLLVADLDEKVVLDYLHEQNLEHQIGNFVITNYIPNTDLPAILNQAELFLYPSLRESFGIPLLEAMACGLPVLTGKESSLPEIAQDAAFQVDVRDKEALIEALHHLRTNAALRKTLRERGLKRCQSFHWRNTAIETLKEYRKLGSV